MKDPIAESARWLEQAKRDLDAARTLYDNAHWWVVCFQSQQAAEKAVKAFLYACGQRIVTGHSVAELVKVATSINRAFEQLTAAAGQLDRYYIPTRYPNGLPGGIPADAYFEEDARQALSGANFVLEFVESTVSELEGN